MSTYTHLEMLVALLNQVGAVEASRQAYYDALLRVDKNDALAELNRQQRRLDDGVVNIKHLLQLGDSPVDATLVEELIDRMTKAQSAELRLFAEAVTATLDAQQTYYKLANTGYTKEKSQALERSKSLEKTLRGKAQYLLTRSLAYQPNLF